LKEFLKSLNIWQSYGGKLITSSTLVTCPAERRIRLRSDVSRAGTVVTASCYDEYSSVTLTSWSTSIKLM